MQNTLLGILYVTLNTRNLAEFQQQALELVQDKQREGMEVVTMGDFNAHFSEHRVEMDHRASLLLSMSNTLGLNVLNWLTHVYGKFTWSSGSKKSTLDYISTSQWWVEHTRNLLVDEQGGSTWEAITT